MVVIRPCATAAAYEALPDADLRLDIPTVRSRLENAGWRTLADAGVMLVVQKGPDSASVFRNGKLLVKTLDPGVAQRVWVEVSAEYGRPTVDA